jgi:pimeloyl-ACP methyl ester carboxylesterase
MPLVTLLLSTALAGDVSLHATEPQLLPLPDGRDLAWIEVGTPDGPPVLFLHGGADSRLAALLLADAAAAAGVRLIAPERPGFGRSSPQPGRTIMGCGDDMALLADALSIDTFAVVGHSGGGPHALAVAARMPDRVRRVTVVAGAAPEAAGAAGMVIPFRVGRWLSIRWPAMHRRLLERHLSDLSDAERFIEQYGRISPGDRALFEAHPGVGEALVADMREGYAQGVDAAWHEASLYYSDWGFPLSDVRAPVELVYSRQDPNAAPGWGPWLAERLPDSSLTLLDDEGHISILINHAEGILRRSR